MKSLSIEKTTTKSENWNQNRIKYPPESPAHPKIRRHPNLIFKAIPATNRIE